MALDPTTGRELWSYDPRIDQSLDYGDGLINRGAATWLDPVPAAGKVCQRRIFEAFAQGDGPEVGMNERCWPMLAVRGEPFDSAEYLFEVKWNGIRALAARHTQVGTCGAGS